MSKKLLSTSLFAFALSTAALPALAADMSMTAEQKSQTVSYQDLDLTTEAGATELKGRIERAAANVCAPGPMSAGVADAADYSACVDSAVDEAVSQIGAPLVQTSENTTALTTLAQ